MKFRGEYTFLSNMFPCEVLWEGKAYKSSESVYQMMKCANESDKTMFQGLNGYQAKKMGRHVRMRRDWNEIKLGVMREVLDAKFDNPWLAEKLMKVEGNIVEDNHWHDRYWGRCNGEGLNHLGKLLMEVRDAL